MNKIKALLICILCFTAIGMSAQVQISGKVTDRDNQPLLGAAVVEKGTSNGVITNYDGEFVFQASSETAIIEVSYIGYLKQEFPIKNKVKFDVVLLEDATEVEEIVVVGYGTMKKSDLTGAVSSVDVKKLDGAPVADIAQALQGRVAGVQVTQNSGEPGAGTNIKIRGTGTINNSSPLYVVDGIVTESIDDIPAENIKSLEVLKDAASSSIYGARAANGVVIITTRGGTAGSMKVTLSAYTAVQDYWNKIETMDSHEYDIFYNLGGNADYIYENPNTFDAPNSWLDEVSQLGIIQKYNVGLSGGSDKVTYRINGDVYDNKGMIKGSHFRRYNFTSDLRIKLNEKLTFRTNISYANKDQESVPGGTFKKVLTIDPRTSYYTDEGYLNNGTPVAYIEQRENNKVDNNVNLKFYLDWDISKRFKFTTRAGWSRQNFNRSKFTGVNEKYEYETFTDQASISRYTSEDLKWQWENILNYNFSKNKHTIGMVGVVALEGKRSEWFDNSIKSSLGNNVNAGYPSSGLLNPSAGGNASEWSSMGLAYRLNYNYDNRYLLQFNTRADASSRFAASERWGVFPSLSAGWNLTNENFWNGPEWINSIKVRGGWGMLGNNRIDNYGRYTTVNQVSNVIYGVGNNIQIGDSWYPNTVANSGILWEKTTTYNAGLDLKLFKRVFINADVFAKYTTDMLLRVPVAPSAGMGSAPFQNAGEVENKGVELSFEYKNKIRNFYYSLGFNVSHIVNEVTSLGDSNEPVWGGKQGADSNLSTPHSAYYTTKTVVGRPIGSFYGYVTDGLFYHQSQADLSPQAGNANAGDVRFVDVNGDQRFDEYDRTFIGSPHPDFVFGFNIDLEYKRFDLTCLFEGVYGNEIWNRLNYNLLGSSKNNNVPLAGSLNDYYMAFDNSVYFNDNTENVSLPNPKSTYRERNYLPSTFYVEDGSYLRLKNLQLGYRLPVSVCERWNIGSARVYVGGYNLLTFTNYSGLDPEVGTSSSSTNTALGIDDANYPQARTYMFGLNVSF